MTENRLLILNHFGTNKGDAAILIGTIEVLKEVIPYLTITVESSDPTITVQRTRGLARVVERVVERAENKSRAVWGARTFLWVIQSILWGLLLRIGIDCQVLFNQRKRQLLQAYREADMVLSGGGGYIRDNSGLVGMLPLYSILLALLIKKPTMIYANSIGPVRTGFYSYLARFILNRVDVITLRDPVSREVLDRLQITAPPIYLTADAAFLFHPSTDHSNGENILLKEGIGRGDGPIVGITVMRWHYPGSEKPAENHATYERVMADTADHLCDTIGAQIVFISMNTEKQRQDEVHLAEKIINQMRYRYRARVLDGEYSPEDLKDIISQLDLIVGTRFHSLIFASTLRIPLVSIMYEHKAEGIMRMLGMNEFVCDIHTLTKEDLIQKVDMMWEGRERQMVRLDKPILVLQKLALVNAVIAQELLDKSHHGRPRDIAVGLKDEYQRALSIFNPG